MRALVGGPTAGFHRPRHPHRAVQLVLAPRQDLSGGDHAGCAVARCPTRPARPTCRWPPRPRGHRASPRTRSPTRARSRSGVCAAPCPAIPRSANAAVPFALVVTVSVPCSAPPPLAMLALTTTPLTPTLAASLTRTTGCRAGTHTSRSSAVVGGWVSTVILAGGPAATASSGDCGSETGWVGSSPVQVTETAASPAARHTRMASRDEIMAGWTCTKRASDKALRSQGEAPFCGDGSTGRLDSFGGPGSRIPQAEGVQG